MATVSHLPHVVANALVAQAAAELTRDSERMPEVGPSFRDATRVAGSNPAIWGDIFASNREAVADGDRGRRAAGCGEAAELIRSGDAEALAAWHAAAAEDRRRLLEAESAGRAAARAAGRRRQPARDRSPSWRWRSARPGSTSRTWRCTRRPT